MRKKVLLFLLFSFLLFSMTNAQITFEKIEDFEFQDEISYFRGISWVDVDNDFDLDVMISGESGTPPNTVNETAIFLNDGTGVFTRSELITSSQMGAFTHGWADIDNDGDLDVYIAATWNFGGINELWLNNDGTSFTNVTTSGATPNMAAPYEGTVSWGDYDADGFVDLFLARWNQQTNIVYKNNGDGTFYTVNLGALTTDQSWTSGGIWGDYDNDQDLDIYVFNYQNSSGDPGKNDLFENNGDGTFTKSLFAGEVVTDTLNTRSANWVDVNNDGWLDIFVANQSANNKLYLNNGDGTFTTQNIFGGNTTWSSNWGDFDNDGDQDLITVGLGPHESFLLANDGQGNFTNVSSDHSNIFPLPFSSSLSTGVMFADYNNDGWLDLHITQPNTSADYLFENNGADCISWLKIKCTGTESNWAAIGTTIRAKATINGNAVWQMRQVSAQTSRPGQNPMWADFGLGNAGQVDSLVFEWPSGVVCVFTDIPINQFVEVVETCEMITIIDAPPIPGVNGEIVSCLTEEDMLLQSPSGELDGSWSASCGDCIDENGLLMTSTILPGNYEVYYKMGGICGFRDTIFVTIAPNPELTISNDTTVLEGAEIELFAAGAESYVWTPSSVLSCEDCANPIFTATEETTFNLTGISEFGCQDTTSVTVFVNPEPDFEIPNIFTPNGDGVNDIFNAVFVGDVFDSYHLQIYNRWGKLIFESFDPTLGWDGQQENTLSPSDVFAYVFTYELTNGQSGILKGDVTLLR